MPLVLHPLFATSCIDDPLPGATDAELEAVLLDTPALRASTEMAPAPEPAAAPDNAPSNTPPSPDLDYEPPRPGMGRR